MSLKVTLLRLLGKKRVALASYPRSGNTWLRFMIEQSTGQLSGSIYPDKLLARGAEGIVIKTHNLDSDRYTAAIHLLRNPIDVIESHYYWQQEIGGKTSLTWGDHIIQTTEQWRAHTIHWLDTKCPVLRVRYEDLHQNTAGQLQVVLKWLGFDLPEEKIMQAVEAAQLEKMRVIDEEVGQKFFRRGTVGEGVSSFMPEQIQYVLSELDTLMVECGYETLLKQYQAMF